MGGVKFVMEVLRARGKQLSNNGLPPSRLFCQNNGEEKFGVWNTSTNPDHCTTKSLIVSIVTHIASYRKSLDGPQRRTIKRAG